MTPAAQLPETGFATPARYLFREHTGTSRSGRRPRTSAIPGAVVTRGQFGDVGPRNSRVISYVTGPTEPQTTLSRLDAGMRSRSPRHAMWWSGRTSRRAPPSRDRQAGSTSASSRSGTPIALALSSSSVASEVCAVTSRVKSVPSRSRSGQERPERTRANDRYLR
jgi:hypothetical protein